MCNLFACFIIGNIDPYVWEIIVFFIAYNISANKDRFQDLSYLSLRKHSKINSKIEYNEDLSSDCIYVQVGLI